MNIQYLLFTLGLRCATDNDDDDEYDGGMADTRMAIFSGCEVTSAGKTKSRRERVFDERGEKSRVWGF